MKTRLFFAAGVLSLLIAGAAGAMPDEGSKLPNGRVEDAKGRGLELRTLLPKPILIVYEDKKATAQNVALKDQLAKLAKGDRYRDAIALVAVADVSDYNYWPIKGFVKDAIEDESKKAGTTIFCDWDGTFRTSMKLRAGWSNVVLAGRDGKIIFSKAGTLSVDDRARLLSLLRSQVEAR